MSKVLFGWELGANLGHAMPLAAIARRIAPSGVEIVVAARDLSYARLAFSDINATLLQAPVWSHHQHFGSSDGQASYLDVLAQIGFADPNKLSAVTHAWVSILDLVKPAIIVADHSPALLLAARIRNIDVVQVGSGFTMPPADYERLPPIRADRAPIIPETRATEAMARVVSEYGAIAPRSLVELFRTKTRVVFGCPELDPYAPFRKEPLHLPPEPLPAYVAPPVVPRLFVYLGAETPHLDTIVQAIAELGVQLDVYLRGSLTPHSRFLALAGHKVYATPPPLADVLPNVSHVFAAAGAYTSHAAFSSGRPLLALAMHGEAELNSLTLSRLGVARKLHTNQSDGQVKQSIQAFIRDHALLQRAVAWGKTLSLRTQPDGGLAAETAILSALRSATQPALQETHP